MVHIVLRHIIIALLFCILFTGQVFAEEERRDKVKAVFLYKFFDYVTWEDERDPVKNPPAVVCVMGRIPFGGTLDYISQKTDSTLKNKKIYIDGPQEAAACHIAFIAKDKYSSKMLTNLPSHVLTVSDVDGFVSGGGMIEMRDKADKIDLVVNLGTVKKATLKMSSRLLKIAEVIR